MADELTPEIVVSTPKDTEVTLTRRTLPSVRIAPSRGLHAFNWTELWAARELLLFMAWRDVIVRYKQSLLGVTWVIAQPVLTMLIFAFIFGRLAHLPSEGQPYALYVFCALLPWQLFAGALSRISSSLVINSNLLTKVYFPRAIIPLSAAIAAVVDFVMSLLVLIVLLVWYACTGHFILAVSWALLTLPFFTMLALLSALAVGLWLAPINALFRDVTYVIPFLTQIWMYLSPVAYSDVELIPHGVVRILYNLNPMVGVIQGFRWALLGTHPPDMLQLGMTTGIMLLVLVTGMFFFTRMERLFADFV